MSKRGVKGRLLQEAAIYFAELGKVPSTYKEMSDLVPSGKPECVTKRKWKRHWVSWGAFTRDVHKHYKEVIELADSIEVKEEPEVKDPLESLRASTTEK
jgi:hypothetical protein